MSLDPDRIRAVLFDYGNTLIQFSRPQVQACDHALGEALERLFGPVDRARLKEIRDADRVAPYRNGLRERDLAEMTTRLVEGLYGRPPGPDEIAVLIRARFDAVVQAIVAPDHVPGLLECLGRRYLLGIVSNYPDAEAIRTSLGRLNLARHFASIVVSADVGRVKPHPLPFTTCLDALEMAPADALYVGDNWLADVQGAKRLGMQVVRTIQYEAPERFDPQPGDFEPDAVIEHLSELPALLQVCAGSGRARPGPGLQTLPAGGIAPRPSSSANRPAQSGSCSGRPGRSCRRTCRSRPRAAPRAARCRRGRQTAAARRACRRW